ncbi:beta-lactamase-like protein [Rhodotorula diobovata]|uniref:Beta-lactamase-like protein n=1 Tax=Rhodotorula diobovata TaxID=5288 RepID=A0A5C5FQ58_9BASI|nr:beta-lactamase-like protein [Rhodotorula diobovata]
MPASAPPPLRDPHKPMSLTLFGTGGSAAVPDVACTTDPAHGCRCCLDTVGHPQSRNVRGNTGAVIRVPLESGEEKTILIDCGKTFREMALKFFPEKGLRKIDACILTHHHADAIDGLDDLRAWTYHSAVEQTIPLYCTKVTYLQIAQSFAYMVSKSAGSGGGAVPSFEWHIMPDDEDWDVCGVRITPFPLHHGIYFTEPPTPLLCLGFLIDQSVLYISDTSFIPEAQWTRLGSYLSLPSPSGAFPSPPRRRSLSLSRARSSASASPPLPRLQALIIDTGGALRLSPSHFGLPQAIATARRLGVQRTYLTDLGHGVSHACWLDACRALSRGERSPAPGEGRAGEAPAWKVRDEEEQQAPHAHVYEGLDPAGHVEDVELFVERALEAVEEWAGGVRPREERLWVRPGFDGLTIEWEAAEGGTRVWDSEYQYDRE